MTRRHVANRLSWPGTTFDDHCICRHWLRGRPVGGKIQDRTGEVTVAVSLTVAVLSNDTIMRLVVATPPLIKVPETE